MRIIGMDIHRTFAEVVALEGTTSKAIGRVGLTRAQLSAFACTLQATDHVIVEATGNATAVFEVGVAEACKPRRLSPSLKICSCRKMLVRPDWLWATARL